MVGTWFVNKKLNQDHPERDRHQKEIQTLCRPTLNRAQQPSFVGRFIKPQITHARFVVVRRPATRWLSQDSNSSLVILACPQNRPATNVDLLLATGLPATKTHWTARVMVNRIWHHVFGTGIVPTTAISSGRCTTFHPELLGMAGRRICIAGKAIFE